jgi:hypothetical protein
MLAASEFEDGVLKTFKHYCPLGCHGDIAAIADDIADNINVAHLDLAVPVPALNRPVDISASLPRG